MIFIVDYIYKKGFLKIENSWTILLINNRVFDYSFERIKNNWKIENILKIMKLLGFISSIVPK